MPDIKQDALVKTQASLILRVRRNSVDLRVGLFEDSRPEDRPLVEESKSVDRESVTSACGIVREIFSTPSQNHSEHLASLAEVGQLLYENILPDQISSLLHQTDARFLHVDIPEDLVGWPWELLHDGREFLCCRFSMGRIVDGWGPEPFHHRPRPSNRASLLFLSNPTGDLPAATKEVERLFKILGDEESCEIEWLNGAIHLESVVEGLKVSDIVHFSGHSLISSESPDRSGWKLADGFLNEKILQSILSGISSLPLVIFSNSCDSSAIQEGSDRSGVESRPPLVSGFLSGGSKHFIGTIGKISDPDSDHFAQCFYQHVLHHEPVGTALRRARLDSRDLLGSGSLTWLQYVLYGDPQVGLFGQEIVSTESRTIVFIDNTRHVKEAKKLLRTFPDAEPVNDDCSSVLFRRPSEAARFALLLQARVRDTSDQLTNPRPPKIALSSGEVKLLRSEDSKDLIEVQGFPVILGEALLGLSTEGQILSSRPVFDNARSVIRGSEIPGIEKVSWLDHGAYRFDALDTPVGICEIGEEGHAPLQPPPDSEKAHRYISPDQEPVLGWRPALNLEIPTAPRWVLVEKLGEGGFGEVWRAEHQHSGNNRVFKFCFKVDRVRALKREATLFRILQESVGEHPQIVQVLGTYFKEPPFYIEMEYVPGVDLGHWFQERIDTKEWPTERRLYVVAQIAEILQVAHNAGVIHRDIKPSNVLVVDGSENANEPKLKLTDFGIGQVQSTEMLAEMTSPGFTETYSRTEMASHSGSRLYMAPEVLVGRASTVASDIYSLGVLLYQVVVGDLSRPLAADWRNDIEDPILLEDLDRCLSGEPSSRFASARELSENLRRHDQRSTDLERETNRARRRKRRRLVAAIGTAVGSILLVLSLALGFGLWREHLAQQETSRQLYYSNILLAKLAVEENQLGRARQLLLNCPAKFRHWEWGRLLLLCNLDHWAFDLGKGEVPTTLDIDPREEFIAVGSRSGKVFVWNLSRRDEPIVLDHGEGMVGSLSFNASTTLLVTRGTDFTRVWETKTWKVIQTVSTPYGFRGNVPFHPTEDIFALATAEPSLFLWKVGSDKPLIKIETMYRAPGRMRFDPEGKTIVALHSENELSQYSVSDGIELHNLKLTESGFASFDWSDDGELAITGLRDGNIIIWEVDSWKRVDSFFNGEEVSTLQFSAEGGLIAAAGRKKTTIWDRNAGQVLIEIEGSGSGVASVKFSRDSNSIYLTSSDSTVRQYPIHRSRGRIPLVAHTQGVNDIRFSPDGKTIVTGCNDYTVTIWSATSCEEIRTILNFDSAERTNFSKDGSSIFVGGGRGGLKGFGTADGSLEFDSRKHEHDILTLSLSVDGKTIATGSADTTIRLWDSQTGEELKVLKGHSNKVTDIAFSPDGSLLGSTSLDGTAILWDKSSGELLFRLEGHKGALHSIAFSPRGEFMVTGGDDLSILGWNPKTGARNSFRADISGSLYDISFSPDGKRIFATKAFEDVLWVFESEMGRELSSFELGGKLDISPDGRTLAIAGDPTRTGLLPSFPWKQSDYENFAGENFTEKIENFKRWFWRNRPQPVESTDDRFEGKRTPRVSGHWDFSEGDISATVGRDMIYYDEIDIGNTESKTVFGLTSELGLPPIEGQPARVMGYPECDGKEGFRLFSDAPPNGSGKLVNRFTLVYDLFYSDDSAIRRKCLMNTNSDNANDADLVISATGGVGVEGEYHGQISANTWHRLACVFDLTRGEGPVLEKYIDGEWVGSQILYSGVDGRWAPDEGTRGKNIVLFGGDDWDNASGYVACIQFRNYAMTAEEVAAMGGPTADGIPITEPALQSPEISSANSAR